MPKGYTATQNTDGTWNVHDVPIFGPLPAGARRNKEPIGREWMERAVALALADAAANYHGPSHIRHTGDGLPKANAGQFVPRRVGKLTYRGAEIDAIFADLVNVPPHVYADLKAGRLPYRSVEVFDWDKPEIQELALLDTDTPFFRFGWDGIAKEIPADWPTTATATPEPAMAFAAVGSGGAALFRFEDAPDRAEPDEKKPDGDEKAEKCRGSARMGAHCQNCDDYVEEKTNMPVTDEDAKKSADQMAALTTEAATFKAQAADFAAKLAAAEKAQGELVAKLAALEAKDAEREKSARIESLVADARKSMDGYNFSAKVEAHVRKLAAGAKPEEDVKEFVALCKETMAKDPPATFADAVGRRHADGDPAAVTKFANGNPDRLVAARKAHEEFAAHRARQIAAGAAESDVMPIDEFIAIRAPEHLTSRPTQTVSA